jgi:hypothetical protein
VVAEGDTFLKVDSPVIVGNAWIAFDPRIRIDYIHLDREQFIPGTSWRTQVDSKTNRIWVHQFEKYYPNVLWRSCVKSSSYH